MQIEFNENGEGFYATFENGWVMSVQWNLRNHASSNTVEIAAWDEDEDVWWNFEEGIPVSPDSSVLGWVTSDKLGEYMDDIASITMGSAELQFIAQQAVTKRKEEAEDAYVLDATLLESDRGAHLRGKIPPK